MNQDWNPEDSNPQPGTGKTVMLRTALQRDRVASGPTVVDTSEEITGGGDSQQTLHIIRGGSE